MFAPDGTQFGDTIYTWDNSNYHPTVVYDAGGYYGVLYVEDVTQEPTETVELEGGAYETYTTYEAEYTGDVCGYGALYNVTVRYWAAN